LFEAHAKLRYVVYKPKLEKAKIKKMLHYKYITHVLSQICQLLDLNLQPSAKWTKKKNTHTHSRTQDSIIAYHAHEIKKTVITVQLGRACNPVVRVIIAILMEIPRF